MAALFEQMFRTDFRYFQGGNYVYKSRRWMKIGAKWNKEHAPIIAPRQTEGYKQKKHLASFWFGFRLSDSLSGGTRRDSRSDEKSNSSVPQRLISVRLRKRGGAEGTPDRPACRSGKSTESVASKHTRHRRKTRFSSSGAGGRGTKTRRKPEVETAKFKRKKGTKFNAAIRTAAFGLQFPPEDQLSWLKLRRANTLCTAGRSNKT